MKTEQAVTQERADLLLIGVAFEVGLHQSVAQELGEKQGARTRVERQHRARDRSMQKFFSFLLRMNKNLGKLRQGPAPISPPALAAGLGGVRPQSVERFGPHSQSVGQGTVMGDGAGWGLKWQVRIQPALIASRGDCTGLSCWTRTTFTKDWRGELCGKIGWSEVFSSHRPGRSPWSGRGRWGRDSWTETARTRAGHCYKNISEERSRMTTSPQFSGREPGGPAWRAAAVIRHRLGLSPWDGVGGLGWGYVWVVLGWGCGHLYLYAWECTCLWAGMGAWVHVGVWAGCRGAWAPPISFKLGL